MDITLDFSRDELFDENGLKRLQDSYMPQNEKSPQERFAFVSKKFASNDEHAQRIYDYASKHWISFSTPILAFGKDMKSLPISCFLAYLEDTREGLINTLSETNWLSMMGGGVGIGVNIRSSDQKSVGVLPHLKTYDASSLAYKQGSTRRGSYATYLDISHPDVIQFIEMRKPTGDPNIRCLNLHHGINISNKFMDIIEKCMIHKNYDDSWPLIDPHTNEVKEIVSAKYLWEKILTIRNETGEPYLHFIDNTNEALPNFFKEKGLFITQSNLCTEILEPTNNERTAVCCLLSVNVEKYDDFQNNFETLIYDVVEFLDNVLQYFIDNAPKQLSRAIFSASQERSIGIGVLGFHSYLQSKKIALESVASLIFNKRLFSDLRKFSDSATLKLGKIRGEAPDAIGTGRRNCLCIAVAPNASSSIIMGNTSPSIEPFKANAYRQDTLSGFFLNKNKNLVRLLEEKNIKNQDEIWSSIISHDGSIQHLDIFTDEEKSIYKTAIEIDQRWLIDLAAERQKFIDQGQSLNLFFRPDVDIKYLHAVHFSAWKKKIKTLYYCRSEQINKADKISEKIIRERIEDINLQDIISGEDCLACQ